MSGVLPGWEDRVRDGLAAVLDPELGFDVVSLGLIRTITARDGEVRIEMTLTSPGCPLSGQLIEEVTDVAHGLLGSAAAVTVALVWEPPWTPADLALDLREQLGWELP